MFIPQPVFEKSAFFVHVDRCIIKDKNIIALQKTFVDGLFNSFSEVLSCVDSLVDVKIEWNRAHVDSAKANYRVCIPKV